MVWEKGAGGGSRHHLDVGRDDPARQTTPRTMKHSVVCKDERDGSKPVSFSLLEKERFLKSKEKGAPKRVEWSRIGIRRPGFTPPLSTSTVHRRLRRWNRGKLWFYPHFFRRLRGWVSGGGGAACIPYSLFTFPYYFSLWGAASQTRPWCCAVCGARRRRGKVRTAHPGLTARSRFAPLPLLSPEKRCALSRGP